MVPTHPQNSEPQYLTVTEAAAYLRAGRRTIIYYIRRGKLREGVDYKKDVGKTSPFIYRIAKPALDRLAQERENQITEHLTPPSEAGQLPLTTTLKTEPEPPLASEPSRQQTILHKVRVEAAKWKTRYESEREWRSSLERQNRGLTDRVTGAALDVGASRQQIENLQEKIRLLTAGKGTESPHPDAEK